MAKDKKAIAEYVSICPTCLMSKPQRREEKALGLLQSTETSTDCGPQTMDFIIDLPPSKGEIVIL